MKKPAVFILWLSLPCIADIYRDFPDELAGYDVDQHIHIHNAYQADSLRRCIIDYFWNGRGFPDHKLPTAAPLVEDGDSLPEALSELTRHPIRSIECLDVEVDYDYHHYSYLIHPASTENHDRLIIVHQGHQGGLKDGIAMVANRLLERGFTILLAQMPLIGWNDDDTWEFASGTYTVSRSGARGHDIFVDTLDGIGGSSLRYFIEPIIVGINYFRLLYPDHRDISMIGLSGGGWTTHIASALDTRINVSFPVAGSYPLYVRPYYRGSAGDAEQILPSLYEETASWLDLYILGGYGEARMQIQTLNQFDNCCFYGIGWQSYDSSVAAAVEACDAGAWTVAMDSTHRSHKISEWSFALFQKQLQRHYEEFFSPALATNLRPVRGTGKNRRPTRLLSSRILAVMANGRLIGGVAGKTYTTASIPLLYPGSVALSIRRQ